MECLDETVCITPIFWVPTHCGLLTKPLHIYVAHFGTISFKNFEQLDHFSNGRIPKFKNTKKCSNFRGKTFLGVLSPAISVEIWILSQHG